MHKTMPVLALLAVSVAVVAPPLIHAESSNHSGKAVFVMTNDADRNQVVSYKRSSDGSLVRVHKFATAGRGSGGVTDPLASQGSLVLSQDGSFLFAVNSGSGELSVFRVQGSTLYLVDVVPCGGSEPVAAAQHGNHVFVLNAGGTNNVVGFRLEWNGKLKRIPNSNTLLSSGNSGPGSIAFSPDGRLLLVTEKATNRIDTFRVHHDGTLSPVVTTPAIGPGTFALLFARNGAALVAETGPAGGANASAISSYAVSGTGAVTPISASVPTLGTANCWLATTPDGRFVYASNSGSSTISGFSIGINGSLTEIPGTVVGTLPGGSTNLDITISSDGRYLYTLDSGTGTVGIFAINNDGSLTILGEVEGLPAHSGINGIAAN